ncbi:MAG: thiamine-phosphate kinase [Kineosporiaceae bacterium]
MADVTDSAEAGAGGPETISDLGEDRLVDSLLRHVRGPGGSGGPGGAGRVLVGPGDDAAVLTLPGALVVSTDTLAQGYDFRTDWSSAAEVGVKLAAQSLADVAAMGARPVGLLISLAAPADLPAGWARELADGIAEECARAGARVVGGDLSPADHVVLTGTALGVLPGGGAAVLRSGARPGDVVALAGRTGPSAAGLALLSAGIRDGAGWVPLLRAHRAPRPDYPAGVAAAEHGATALIDTSDGLLRDAGRIAVASGALLDLDPAALTPAPDLVAAARTVRSEGAPAGSVDASAEPTDGLRRPADLAAEWVLTGGEDHALLACFPPDAVLPPGFRPIGVVREPGTQRPGALVGGRPHGGPGGWVAFG